MSLADIVFWGWYHILDKTIYSYGTEKGVIGAREHSFFISFLFHGINVWTILRYLTAKYFDASIPLYFSLSLSVLIFVIGYLIYFRGNRANRVVNYTTSAAKAMWFVSVSVIYVIVSVYLLFKVGDYVRYHVAVG